MSENKEDKLIYNTEDDVNCGVFREDGKPVVSEIFTLDVRPDTSLRPPVKKKPKKVGGDENK